MNIQIFRFLLVCLLMKYSETVICNDALIQAAKPPPPSRFQRSVQLDEDPPEFCEFPEYDKSQLPPNKPVVVTLSVSLSVSTKLYRPYVIRIPYAK